MLSGRPTSIVVGIPTQLHQRIAFSLLAASAASIAGVTVGDNFAGGTNLPSSGSSQYPLISGEAPCAVSDTALAKTETASKMAAASGLTFLHLFRRND